MANFERTLPGVRLEVQNVTSKHKAECSECGRRPANRRLLTKQGSGRWAKTAVLCVKCGKDFVDAYREQVERAYVLLSQGTGTIRDRKKRETT